MRRFSSSWASIHGNIGALMWLLSEVDLHCASNQETDFLLFCTKRGGENPTIMVTPSILIAAGA